MKTGRKKGGREGGWEGGPLHPSPASPFLALIILQGRPGLLHAALQGCNSTCMVLLTAHSSPKEGGLIITAFLTDRETAAQQVPVFCPNSVGRERGGAWVPSLLPARQAWCNVAFEPGLLFQRHDFRLPVCVSSKNATLQDMPHPKQRATLQTRWLGEIFLEQLNEERDSCLLMLYPNSHLIRERIRFGANSNGFAIPAAAIAPVGLKNFREQTMSFSTPSIPCRLPWEMEAEVAPQDLCTHGVQELRRDYGPSTALGPH